MCGGGGVVLHYKSEQLIFVIAMIKYNLSFFGSWHLFFNLASEDTSLFGFDHALNSFGGKAQPILTLNEKKNDRKALTQM